MNDIYDEIHNNLQKNRITEFNPKSKPNVIKSNEIARLEGDGDVYNFKIAVYSEKIGNFDFLKIRHQKYGDVLCQIFNMKRNSDKLIGLCKIIGFREDGILKRVMVPFHPLSKIELADDRFIEDTIGLNRVNGAFIGTMDNHDNLKISMNYKSLLTNHISIVAKSGAGKSYSVGVLLEEIMNLGVPIVILDPHDEYNTLRYPNNVKEDIERLNKQKLVPLGFANKVKLWSPDTNINADAEKIYLSLKRMTPTKFIHSMPQKLSASQQATFFNVVSSLNNRVDNLDELIFNISNEESPSKWGLITMLEQIKKDKIFSLEGTPLNEIVRHRRASIISLKGIPASKSEVVVSNLLNDLFQARMREEIPPFLLVVEEAHNFVPEKGVGSAKSKEIIQTIAGEGRKFGLGLCVISQRPAKIDKNVLSQCLTQIIMKLTNNNDLKSVISSSEGLDRDSENEIQQLRIGTCLITGIIDIPLKVNVRARMSKHGGESVKVEGD